MCYESLSVGKRASLEYKKIKLAKAENWDIQGNCTDYRSCICEHFCCHSSHDVVLESCVYA